MRRFSSQSRRRKNLDAIWLFIAKHNQDAADRVEMEILAPCRRLARHPLMGTKRQDITPLAVRFWTLPKFLNYVIVYRPETVPLQVVAVVHGKRNLKRCWKATLNECLVVQRCIYAPFVIAGRRW